MNMMSAFLFTLQVLAATCPLAGGDAVFEARAMLYLVEQIEYNDKNICDNVNMVYKSIVKMSPNSRYSVLPNPSVGEVIIHIPKGSVLTKIEVLDMKGQVLQQQTLKGSNSSISYSLDLPDGLYFVRLTGDNEMPHLEKIVLIRN